MANEMTLFGNAAPSALLAQLGDDVLGKIAGNSGSKRISIEGNVFREIVGGKEVRTSDDRFMHVVVLDAAAIGRTYYSGTYVKGVKAKPICWSQDCNTPAAEVPEANRQNASCRGCARDVKGSDAAGKGRACRFSQRLAVALVTPDGLGNDVYQLSLAATSVFGEAIGQKMPLQSYGRFLRAHNTPIVSIVTEVRFDPAGNMKLVFKAVRPLTSEELERVIEMRSRPETKEAITFTVSQADATPDEVTAPAPLFAPAAKVEAEGVAAPVVRQNKKPTATPTPANEKLASMLGNDWDD